MPTLQEGITAAQAGDKERARLIFQQILRQDRRNEMAWLWLATVVDTKKAIQCLENVLKINPQNEEAITRLNELSLFSTPPVGLKQ